MSFWEDVGLNALLALLVAAIIAVLGAVALMAIDGLYFERRAFVATTACEAQRMQARRKFLSSQVVCVPAYRGTKNDTLTVNGIGR